MGSMRLSSALAWCLVSGLAVSVTFPPQDLWRLSWGALVPWLVALQGASPS
jgi:apolipoprotein N-acyltransferase